MEKLKCPYCGSENLTRMDGIDASNKLGARVMIDIAPDILHCNDCNQYFRDELFSDLPPLDDKI